MKKTEGILLVNMGGPLTQKEMKVFLSNMFKDPCILPFNKLSRHLLSFIISRSRYRKSWKKYQLIGGTPLVRATEKMSNALQQALPEHYKVRYAFSYNQPFVSEVLQQFEQENIQNITVIPLYPQKSLTTTQSVKNDLAVYYKKLNIKLIEEFCYHPLFIQFWADLIHKHIQKQSYQNPLLVFSAHSIPQSVIEQGDSYQESLIQSSKQIAKTLNLEHILAFQSGLGKKWIGPEVKQCLQQYTDKEVVIIPISFVSENLETLYDMDCDILPYAQKKWHYKAISRVRIPELSPLFIHLLKELIEK